MSCANCGGELAAEARFCSRCGRSTLEGGGPFAGPTAQMAPSMMRRPVVITILAILDLLGGALWLLGAAVGVMSIVTGASRSTEDFVILAIILPFGLLAVVAGIGMLQMREYGRLAQIGLSTLGLLGFPIGTIISALILYYLTRPGAKVLFSEKSVEQLSADEQSAVIQLQQSGGAGVLVALVVLVLIVAMTGILAAIAIPNLLTAMQRSKQKRTMADVRLIATAWEAYATDHNTYLPVHLDRQSFVGSGGQMTAVEDTRVVPLPSARLNVEDLERVLSPTYVRNVPRLDGWSREIEFYIEGGGQEYLIRSLGNDGVAENNYDVGAFNSFDCDIVYSLGAFVTYPEGIAARSDRQGMVN